MVPPDMATVGSFSLVPELEMRESLLRRKIDIITP
jgi:hypothetical protein